MSDIDYYEVKHLKLSTGEEVLAEIIEETDYDLVVKRALRLQTDIDDDRTRYHSFRPFMTYQDDPEKFKVILLVSDGEDHQENPETLAKEAVEKGIKIFTIGVGTEKGGVIPMKENGSVISYKKDNKGEVVITKMNQQLLQAN